MNPFLIQSLLERNSRLSLAKVKNKAEDNNLQSELTHLENQKKATIRMLEKDKSLFQIKQLKNCVISGYKHKQSETSAYKKLNRRSSSVNMKTDRFSGASAGDISLNNSALDFEQMHNMLFTNGEIDKEKLLCLHLISAHRTETLKPLKKKIAQMCKIHSPVEQLLERSKRKNIHLEQKFTNILPIYTLELAEFGSNANYEMLINDGRLANRILLNRRIRELINTALNALNQANRKKNYEIFEIANDVSGLKALFSTTKITHFLNDLMNSSLIMNCESFILTAPFRVKSVQIEIRTLTGSLEQLLKQIRENVFQVQLRPTLPAIKENDIIEMKRNYSVPTNRNYRRKMLQRNSSEAETSMGAFFPERPVRRISDPEKKIGRHIDKNFIKQNIQEAANARKVEYDIDEEEYATRSRRSSDKSNRSRRRSSEFGGIGAADRPNLQPIRLTEEVRAIMEVRKDDELKQEQTEPALITKDSSEYERFGATASNKSEQCIDSSKRRRSTLDSNHLRVHLKQTTCPACMEKYKIPLPPPKTPRVKPSSVLPPNPGENPDLRTDSRNRLSMLIGKEMFMLQSYDRRFSSGENSRRNSLKRKEMKSCSSDYLNLSPLELAMIEQEIKEKETQKKLEKFLDK